MHEFQWCLTHKEDLLGRQELSIRESAAGEMPDQKSCVLFLQTITVKPVMLGLYNGLSTADP